MFKHVLGGREMDFLRGSGGGTANGRRFSPITLDKCGRAKIGGRKYVNAHIFANYASIFTKFGL